MSTIAATDDYVYTLESGLIYRHKTNSPSQRSVYGGPDGVVSQIMATNRHLYALISDGSCYRRWHDGDSWSAYVVPSSTTHISSDDTTIFALADGVYQRHDTLDTSFSVVPSLELESAIQLDHDEAYSYALTDEGEIYFAHRFGVWTLYPVPLDDVVEITTGLEFVYARNSEGQAYRSKHTGYSGWSPMAAHSDVLSMSIETTHRDRLWYRRASGIGMQASVNWTGKQFQQYWVEAGYADGWVSQQPF